MRNMRKITITVLLTLLLVLITAFGISGTVHSQSKDNNILEEQCYRTARQEYVQVVEKFLEEKGYGSSGVTVNYVINEDNTVEYTVTIHHRKIDRLDEEERSLLAEECKEFSPLTSPSGLSVVFL